MQRGVDLDISNIVVQKLDLKNTKFIKSYSHVIETKALLKNDNGIIKQVSWIWNEILFQHVRKNK